MPVNAQGKQDTRFKPGQSGNPNGRPAKRVSPQGNACLRQHSWKASRKAITRKAVEMAKAGDAVAMRLCMDRLTPPRRDRPVPFTLPKLETAADTKAAAGAIVQAVC